MREKIGSVEEGVKVIFRAQQKTAPEFSLREAGEGEYLDTLVCGGIETAVFSDHYDQRLICLAEYGEIVEDNSALNVYSYCGSEWTLDKLMYRELRIAEYLLHSKLCSVTAFISGGAASLIAVMESGSHANIDVGVTMAPGTPNQCQHRLITSRGMANDCAAGDMTVQQMVACYGSGSVSPELFNDDEYYLYGLDEEQVRKTVTIHAILSGNVDEAEWAEADLRCRKAVDAAHRSDELGECVKLESMEGRA